MFGWPPRVTEEQSLWEIIAYVDGYNKANGGAKASDYMSDDDFDKLLDTHNVPRTMN